MPKRAAQETLEEVSQRDSPQPKRARTASESSGSGNLAAWHDAPTHQLTRGSALNGHQRLQEDHDMSGADSDQEQSALPRVRRQAAPTEGYGDLYLDTIDRAVLDFDFEKLCSISLSHNNVYACLVCGKYFQGRGPKSHAYFHALDVGHHVYINMETKKIYVLPEGYEVKSKSLDDIRFVVDPYLLREEVLKLDREGKEAWDLHGKKYQPGYIGMNNIKANDYFNVVMQALSHVSPLRNYFMLEDFSTRPELIKRFSMLIRKIWNNRAFKTHVSPHELLQQISRQSGKRFDILNQSDPVEFLSWLLNNLHLSLGGSKTKPGTSIIQKVFQGQLKVESQDITAKPDAKERLRFEESGRVQVVTPHYLLLALDLPPTPLFKDESDKNVIPQVPLTSLLSKYDGIRIAEQSDARKRYRLQHPLPPFLLFHIKRFTKNKFVSERNPTIVTFQPRALDMSPYVEPNPSLHPVGEPIWYDLVANVTHEAVKVRDDSVEGEAEKKVWKAQVRDRAKDEWFEIQDLFVERVPAETLFTKEAYLMVWERRKESKKAT
jgi:U4/U6.U5 tri-snRNP-associated protein 2